MPTRSWIPIGLLLLVSASPPVAPALAAPPPPALATLDTPEEECDALIEELDEANQQWVDKYHAAVTEAKEAGTDIPAFSWNNPSIGSFVKRFQAFADKYAGSDGAIPFLAWIAVEGGRSDVKLAKAAVEALCTVHASSEALADHAESIGEWIWIVGRERGAQLLKQLEKTSPVPAVAGWAADYRLEPGLDGAVSGTEAFTKLKAELLAVGETSKDEQLIALITKQLRILEVFALGAVAPDIQGIDLDGAAFALSDYKGKVIFLDFWGDW